MLRGPVDIWQRQKNYLFSKAFKQLLGLICPLQRLKMAIFLEEYPKGCEFHYFNPVPSLKMRGVIPLLPNIFTSGVEVNTNAFYIHFSGSFSCLRETETYEVLACQNEQPPRPAFLNFMESTLWALHSTHLSPQNVRWRRNVFLLQLFTLSFFFGFIHL